MEDGYLFRLTPETEVTESGSGSVGTHPDILNYSMDQLNHEDFVAEDAILMRTPNAPAEADADTAGTERVPNLRTTNTH